MSVQCDKIKVRRQEIMLMESRIKSLAQGQGIENIQQFAIAAAIPWATAKNIWTGNLAFRHLITLVKAARALNCHIYDLYDIIEREALYEK